MTDGIAKLTVESDHEWTGNANANGAAAGLNYNLKGEGGKSQVVFDIRKGRLVKWEDSHPLAGSVTVGGAGAGGQKLDVSIPST